MSLLDDVILNRRNPVPQLAGPQAATVLGVDGDRLRVSLEEFPDQELSCSWSRPLAQTTMHSHSTSGGSSGSASLTYDPGDPPVGTRCLVLLVGNGVADPWVVTFASWPS